MDGKENTLDNIYNKTIKFWRMIDREPWLGKKMGLKWKSTNQELLKKGNIRTEMKDYKVRTSRERKKQVL